MEPTLGALAVALLVLTVFVLPAEYGTVQVCVAPSAWPASLSRPNRVAARQQRRVLDEYSARFVVESRPPLNASGVPGAGQGAEVVPLPAGLDNVMGVRAILTDG